MQRIVVSTVSCHRRFTQRRDIERSRLLQRIVPVVLVPAPVNNTAKPAIRANFPPLVIGKTTGTLLTRLNASGDTIRTGRPPFCSCPCVASSATSQISPRFIRSVHRPRVCPQATLSLVCCARVSDCIERATHPGYSAADAAAPQPADRFGQRSRLLPPAATATGRAEPEHSQHDRAADLTQMCGAHNILQVIL